MYILCLIVTSLLSQGLCASIKVTGRNIKDKSSASSNISSTAVLELNIDEPWEAVLVFKDEEGVELKWGFGALVSEQDIVSTASLLACDGAASVDVYLGTDNTLIGNFPPSRWVYNEDYNPDTNEKNIGVVRMPQSVTFSEITAADATYRVLGVMTTKACSDVFGTPISSQVMCLRPSLSVSVVSMADNIESVDLRAWTTITLPLQNVYPFLVAITIEQVTETGDQYLPKISYKVSKGCAYVKSVVADKTFKC